MSDVLEYVSQSPVLTAIFLILIGIWVFELLRARARYSRGEKLDRYSWMVVAQSIILLAVASFVLIPRELDRARSAAERAMERHKEQQEEIRRLEGRTTQSNKRSID